MPGWKNPSAAAKRAMRPSSRQTCSQLPPPPSARRAPTVAASCPSGAPYSVTVRGCSASKRASGESAFTPLLDDLIGPREDRLRKGKTERLRGLQVDGQLQFGHLLNRQLRGFSTLQDFAGIVSFDDIS